MSCELAKVFVGYDAREAVAYSVLAHSINIRASIPVSITPIMLSQIASIYKRPKHELQSTEFSFSRFLVPYLSGYEGWSIFMDCDMIMLEDIKKIWDLRDDKYSVMCVKHDYTPKSSTKFLGQVQTKYEKKNWSSVMLFNNKKCKKLSPDYVNNATGLELHQFRWLDSEKLIGDLPIRWNHLVGEEKANKDAAIVHYTISGPYFSDIAVPEYCKEWFEEKENMLYVENYKT